VIGPSSTSVARLLALLLSLAVTLAPQPLAAQALGEVRFPITIDQNAIMRQYAPPLTRPKTVGVSVSAPIAGIPPELHAETRFRLASVEIEGVQPAGAVYWTMDQADVRRVLAYERTMIGSDGLPHDIHPHPRLWGTFPRMGQTGQRIAPHSRARRNPAGRARK
jgi:hypothetical protein